VSLNCDITANQTASASFNMMNQIASYHSPYRSLFDATYSDD